MKKLMLGLAAAFAFASLATPAFAEEAAAPAPAEKPAKEKKAKKAKKAEKPAEGAAPAEGEKK